MFIIHALAGVIFVFLISFVYGENSNEYNSKYHLRTYNSSQPSSTTPSVIIKSNKTISKPQIPLIYDRSSKLKVSLDRLGLTSSDSIVKNNTIRLKITTNGIDYLSEEFYRVNVALESLEISLVPKAKWVDLTNRIPPVGLILTSLSDYHNIETPKNYLSEPIIIARVISVPIILESSKLIDFNQSILHINGTGLIGGRSIKILFDPFLLMNSDYEIISSVPLLYNSIELKLLPGAVWRKTSGPLKIMGIDTGAGLIKVNGESGKTIAIINAFENDTIYDTAKLAVDNLIFPNRLDYHLKQMNYSSIHSTNSTDNHIIHAGFKPPITQNNVINSAPLQSQQIHQKDTHINTQVTIDKAVNKISQDSNELYVYENTESIYQNTKFITITIKTNIQLIESNIQIKLNNNYLLNNVNYTIDIITKTNLYLKLNDKSSWIIDDSITPIELSLSSIDIGYGYQPIKCIKSSNEIVYGNCIIATIHPIPKVLLEPITIDKSKDKVLIVHGKGFIPNQTYIKLLPTSIDNYIIDVIDGFTLRIELLPGKQWADDSQGVIYIQSISTLSIHHGWIDINKKLCYYNDIDNTIDTNKITIYSNDNYHIYNSIGKIDIPIIGKGFITNKLSNIIIDNNNIINTIHYQILIQSDNYAIIRLIQGHHWVNGLFSSFPYQLNITNYNNINCNINIALVYDNWIVVANNTLIIDNNIDRFIIIRLQQEHMKYNRNTKFNEISNLDLSIYPTNKENIVISSNVNINVIDITIRLNDNSTWLPNYLSQTIDQLIPLQIYGLTINNDKILYDIPITIGLISSKPKIITESYLCEDTCESAHNGICEDKSNKHYHHNTNITLHICKIGTDCSDCNGIDSNRHDIQQLIHAANQHIESKQEN